MRDPYKPRRDFGRLGLVVLAVLAVVVAGLLVFAVFRPGPSAEQKREEQAFETQMDRSQAQYEAGREQDEAARAKAMR